jgi:hypothetical protein
VRDEIQQQVVQLGQNIVAIRHFLFSLKNSARGQAPGLSFVAQLVIRCSLREEGNPQE